MERMWSRVYLKDLGIDPGLADDIPILVAPALPIQDEKTDQTIPDGMGGGGEVGDKPVWFGSAFDARFAEDDDKFFED